MFGLIGMTDGYKLDHRRQYPVGTEYVYSNFTARSTRIGGQDAVIFFGLQRFLMKYFTYQAIATFFDEPAKAVRDAYREFLRSYLGEQAGAMVGTDHIMALHKLGYLPLEIRALPEGTAVPYRVPMLTIENTHPDFFWLTNYFETLLSCNLWLPCTSATTALRYRKILTHYSSLTTGKIDLVPYQGHDFSFRGLEGVEGAELSGAGHLLSFLGTDCIPAIQMLKEDYFGTGTIGISVPATEHSVMCAGGQGDELATFARLLDLYPSGYISIVSDTWDLWKVLGTYLPTLKEKILDRDGALIIRPDSGDPVLILTGDASATPGSLQHKGVVESLWDIFGGAVSPTGYKVLDSHIGTIYGDSITVERAQAICERLKEKGFASTNVVFGIGSYTYQYVTRDTNGFAMKATWAQVNGEERLLQKDPVTDTSGKKSARGRLVVVQDKDGLRLIDGLTKKEQEGYGTVDLLQPVWRDGNFMLGRTLTLAEIRQRVASLVR